MKMTVISLCSVFLLASLEGCHATTESTSSTKVINGKDASAEYPAVVTYSVTLQSGQGDCTGTFVSDTVMITAGHCVADAASASDLFIPATAIRAVDFRIQPSFASKDFGNSMPYDMAVIKFPPGTAPATMNLAKSAPKIGDPLTIVGFGQTDLQQNGAGAGTKRSGNNTVRRLEAGLIMFSGTFASTNQEGKDGASSYGDSGGPLLINGELTGTCSGEFDRSESDYTDTYVNVFSSTYQQFLREATENGYDIPSVSQLLTQTPSTETGTIINTETITALMATRRQDQTAETGSSETPEGSWDGSSENAWENSWEGSSEPGYETACPYENSNRNDNGTNNACRGQELTCSNGVDH